MTETGLPLLATDTVRCVGEAIACVVAEDPYQARDAVDLVEVDYDPLPVVIDIEKALEADSPLVHESMDSNVSFRTVAEAGDIEAAIARADRVVKLRLVNQRLLPLFMEPRCLAADYNVASGQMTIWATSQFPHLLRTQFSKLLGIPEHNLRLIVPEVGGGFGAKANFYPDEVLTGHLAVRFGRSVKWVEDRSEDFITCIHGRDQIDYIEAPVTNDGKLLGLRMQGAGRSGRLPTRHHPGHPGADGGDGQRLLRLPGLSRRGRGHLHAQDRHCCLSRRRPARSDLPHRAHDGRHRWRAEPRSGRSTAPQLYPARSVPLHHPARQRIRQRRLRRLAGPGAGDD